MGMFDTVTCEYPLPDPAHQRLEYQTKDLECSLLHYTITRLGRLVLRGGQSWRGSAGPGSDVELPFHGVLHLYTSDPNRDKGLVEYAVHMTYGRVDTIRPASADDADEGSPEGGAGDLGVTQWGRPLTAQDLAQGMPERIELVGGQIPGAEALLLLLMTQLGWNRVMALARCGGRGTPPPEDGEDSGNRAAEHELLANLRRHRPQLESLLAACSDHWGYEDPVYRYYHQSFKVYHLQRSTVEIVDELQSLAPGRPLDPRFQEIVTAGTGVQFSPDHNTRWSEVTRPFVEAFLHARYFLEMAVRYATLEAPPHPLPSGYAALLVLYGLR